MANTIRRTPDLHEIKDPYSLAEAWVSAKLDCDAAKQECRPDEEFAALEQKFNSISEWLAACFLRADVDIILVPLYETALVFDCGRITRVEADGWALPLAPRPEAGEPAIHPGPEDVQPVTFAFLEFDYMDY